MAKKRILITYVANRYIAVDISSVRTETVDDGGIVPWLCFSGWPATAHYLRTLRADEAKVQRAFASLRKVSAAVVVIDETSTVDTTATGENV